MKNLRFLLLVLISTSFLLTCKKDDKSNSSDLKLPEIITIDVSNITQNTAICGGSIVSDGGYSVTSRGVCWSVSPNPTTSHSKTIDGAGGGSFVSTITGLIPDTTYFVRAYATNKDGTSYGVSFNFRTLKSVLPVVSTLNVTEIEQTTAICGGEITFDGGLEVTARGVCWGTTGNPTISSDTTLNGSGIGYFNSLLTGLIPNTTYAVRAYAINADGVSYGQSVMFKTKNVPSLPIVQTLSVEMV